MQLAAQTIRETFTKLRRTSKTRHREIAEHLGVAEGELIAAHVGADANDPDVILHATRLRGEWSSILSAVESIGEVMALTRNASCVHEKTGVYRKVSRQGHIGLVLGGEIDLRVFYEQWAHGFAVIEETESQAQQSLQFFDASGIAIHKIFLRPSSHADSFNSIAADFADVNQDAGITTVPAAAVQREAPDGGIDVAGFRSAWSSLRDTHDFFGLLKRFGVTRTQALRLAEARFVQRVDTDNCQGLLQAAAAEGVSIMVFVGNPGMIQIHSGPVRKVAMMGPWVNVLDPGFNLHLREDQIASAWIVKKPTVDGLVTSLELFDAAGDAIAMFFGERKPGKPELWEWRALIDRIQKESQQCAA